MQWQCGETVLGYVPLDINVFGNALIRSLPVSVSATGMEVRGWALFLFFVLAFLLDLSLVSVISELERALAAETHRADRAMRELAQCAAIRPAAVTIGQTRRDNVAS